MTSPTPLPVDTSLDPDQLYARLGSREAGLTTREAQRRLAEYGPNAITHTAGPRHGKELLRQFTHPLALLLWVAAGLAVIGALVPLALAIVAVIVLNAVFAFFQELQAERATEALALLLPTHARVRRAGRITEIDATELVPGDVVLLGEGDRLSADARLVGGGLEVDMSALTGESQPVARQADAAATTGDPLACEHLVFGGTMVAAGDAEAVVFATGMATQLGRIASLSQRVQTELSPLQVQVNRAAQLIAAVAVIAGVVFFALGTLVAGLPLRDALVFAIGLLVANVPEGLLPIITLALAVAVRRMARRRALVKRLTAVETLGCTDVICTDKTGTLTCGEMSVVLLWTQGHERTITPAAPEDLCAEPMASLLRTAVRCNNADVGPGDDGDVHHSGDPGEVALMLAAQGVGVDLGTAQDERRKRRVRLYSFDARRKRMTTLDDEGEEGLHVHVKGAPLELLECCQHVRTAAGSQPLDDAAVAEISAACNGYATRGLRVLGFAERRVANAPRDRDAAESDLTFLGLIAMHDPPRPDVAEAVAACHRAGIRIVVITGDHGLTAASIAREVGISSEEARVIGGAELDAMPEARRDEVLADPTPLIVARSSPETKLHIVDALRAQGHVVAMTGDGVNDAPALRRADIGVAMGMSGTDVARENATMVLTDDSFSSIVAAIEEGRIVYDNIRKFVGYIFAHATPEVVPFLIYALAGGAVPLPLTALQILAIDLGTETLPALALGREPAEPGIMDRPPRPANQGILDRPLLTRAWLWLGLLEAALVTAGFFWVLHRGGWSWGADVGSGTALHQTYLTATTMTFAGITACQVGTALAARTTTASLRQIGPFSNPLLLWGIVFELAFAAAVIYLPPLQSIFLTEGLGAPELALLAAFPVLVWGSDELRRWMVRCRVAHASGDK